MVRPDRDQRYGEEQALRVEPGLAGALPEVLESHVALLGVVRERVGVDLEQRLLVAGTERADLHTLGDVDRLQVRE